MRLPFLSLLYMQIRPATNLLIKKCFPAETIPAGSEIYSLFLLNGAATRGLPSAVATATEAREDQRL
jgi:hypothetical protein